MREISHLVNTLLVFVFLIPTEPAEAGRRRRARREARRQQMGQGHEMRETRQLSPRRRSRRRMRRCPRCHRYHEENNQQNFQQTMPQEHTMNYAPPESENDGDVPRQQPRGMGQTDQSFPQLGPVPQQEQPPQHGDGQSTTRPVDYRPPTTEPVTQSTNPGVPPPGSLVDVTLPMDYVEKTWAKENFDQWTTKVHEGTHQLNSEIRNDKQYSKSRRVGDWTYNDGVNSVHLGGGKFALVDELWGVTKHDVGAHLPQNLRDPSKYPLYITEATAPKMDDGHGHKSEGWIDKPTHLLDEFGAYVTEYDWAMKHYNWVKKHERGFILSGAMSFVPIGLALMSAAREKRNAGGGRYDWQSDASYQHLKGVVAHLVEQAVTLYREAKSQNLEGFARGSEERMLANLRSSRLAQVAKAEFGQDWWDRVIGN